jgi:hypothetical protein
MSAVGEKRTNKIEFSSAGYAGIKRVLFAGLFEN